MSVIGGRLSKAHNSEKFYSNEALIGDMPMSFEVGRIAKQAAGSVWVRWGDSIVLVTVCASSSPKEGADFFPLTCEYVEKTYAAGKIPGGYFKREAKPRESEVLTSRIIDRSIRPLFPDGFCNEVQVIATVVSHDGEHDTDVMALCGASMALHVSQIPFAEEGGPIAGVRVGRIDGKIVANPTKSEMAKSDIDMMVALSKDAIVMVEGGAHGVSEAELIDALFFAHAEGQKVIAACHDMRENMGKEKMSFKAPEREQELWQAVESAVNTCGLAQALQIKDKIERYSTIAQAKQVVLESVKESLGADLFAQKNKTAAAYFDDMKKDIMRTDVIKRSVRIDGRGFGDIRNICIEVGVLPKAHGSVLFTRGETQALVALTLGTKDDEQRLDTLQGDVFSRFMLHYNFPPFSVGEAKMMRGTSRREIGHGALAERAVKVIVPSPELFPYTMRVVSEITESNGSSSMASVCGATLAMWDAGIQTKAPVAGIAMGLIKEGNDVAILSDILGDEDHLGDMDFKVCGSENGVTAIQMDIKIAGLSREILTNALEQARVGRLHILSCMKEALPEPRKELPDHAPRIVTLRINPDKIRDIIGPGGKVIREIIARTGAKVDVNDDGQVQICAVGKKSIDHAIRIIEDITQEAKVNKTYKGHVCKIVEFGAFVEIFPGTQGLLHISELADKRVDRVEDILQTGDEVRVKVLSIDRDGKIRLSRKQADPETAAAAE